MKQGQEITHKKYGEAKILQVYVKKDKLVALLLDLLTDEGKIKFYTDRKGALPRCYEDNLALIENK